MGQKKRGPSLRAWTSSGGINQAASGVDPQGRPSRKERLPLGFPQAHASVRERVAARSLSWTHQPTPPAHGNGRPPLSLPPPNSPRSSSFVSTRQTSASGRLGGRVCLTSGVFLWRELGAATLELPLAAVFVAPPPGCVLDPELGSRPIATLDLRHCLWPRFTVDLVRQSSTAALK